jgi:GxxExxY protein
METQNNILHKDLVFGNLSDKIINSAVKVHKKIGPGFKENIYEKAVMIELEKKDIKFINQAVIKLNYEGILLGNQRVDFLVEDKIILELKAVSEINSIHKAQMISYLKTANKKVGLLLNFAKPILEIKRLVN